jgi:hypothetical protein
MEELAEHATVPRELAAAAAGTGGGGAVRAW